MSVGVSVSVSVSVRVGVSASVSVSVGVSVTHPITVQRLRTGRASFGNFCIPEM